ncbi:MAG: HPr family phosphocarrier protein [Candidatus Omnitrophica bacterium]|nr:HPr family phosphocarrier protein [Candidatus Omnitrophota bacterium]MDD5670328.1 HPr family phosphocarrier protein [Candidatus Omnitrophota bacterium]
MNPVEHEVVEKISVIIPCHLGIHARCAARIIPFLMQFESEIRVRKGSQVVNGKSILGLMSLGAFYKSKLEFEIVGADAESAQEAIEAFFKEANYCADH